MKCYFNFIGRDDPTFVSRNDLFVKLILTNHLIRKTIRNL